MLEQGGERGVKGCEVLKGVRDMSSRPLFSLRAPCGAPDCVHFLISQRSNGLRGSVPSRKLHMQVRRRENKLDLSLKAHPPGVRLCNHPL